MNASNREIDRGSDSESENSSFEFDQEHYLNEETSITKSTTSGISTITSSECEPQFLDFRRGKGVAKGKLIKWTPRSSREKSDDFRYWVEKLEIIYGKSNTKSALELFYSLEKEKRHDEADGIILSLIKAGAGERQLRCLLQIGGGRFARLKETKFRKHIANNKGNGSSLTDADIAMIKNDITSWDVEPGYPCAHRRTKMNLNEAGLSWKTMYDRFVKKCVAANRRIISYKTWMKYRLALAPQYSFCKTKEDECDVCSRLNILLDDLEHTSAMKDDIKKAKG